MSPCKICLSYDAVQNQSLFFFKTEDKAAMGEAPAFPAAWEAVSGGSLSLALGPLAIVKYCFLLENKKHKSLMKTTLAPSHYLGSFFIYFLNVLFTWCSCAFMFVGSHVCVEVRGVCSLSPPCPSHQLNSGHQTWQQESLPPEPV